MCADSSPPLRVGVPPDICPCGRSWGFSFLLCSPKPTGPAGQGLLVAHTGLGPGWGAGRGRKGVRLELEAGLGARDRDRFR